MSKKMKLVVLGAPGAGKGTQSRNLAAKYDANHISTGDILRAHVNDGTELGNEIGAIINAGELAPDQMVIDLVKNEIRQNGQNGFVVDGFPRTLVQAEGLDEMSDGVTMAISVEVPDEVIVERMSGRVICPDCNAMYHTHYHPPVTKNVCDHCGSALMQREDDKAQTVQRRLTLYHQLTEPIIQYYADKGKLIRANGVGDIDKITNFIITSLEAACAEGAESKEG